MGRLNIVILNIVILLSLLSRFLIGAWLAFKMYGDVSTQSVNNLEDTIALFLEVIIFLIVLCTYKREKSISILCFAQFLVCISSLIVVITDQSINNELALLLSKYYSYLLILAGVLFIAFMISKFKEHKAISLMAIISNVLMVVYTAFIEVFFMLPLDVQDILFKNNYYLFHFMNTTERFIAIGLLFHYLYLYAILSAPNNITKQRKLF